MSDFHSTLLYTTRNETDGPLEIVEGEFPEDIYGHVYIIYPVGSVNSGGLPFPKTTPDGKKNPEYGTPIMNGDGYMVKIDLNGHPELKARLVKSPSYYADEATKVDTPLHEPFGFGNMGIARMSMMLGSKNPLNTALTPVKFADDNTALLAGYDVGRPYIVDPVSLELLTPMGSIDEWLLASPEFLPWPFPFIQTTAHPSYDPYTKELFTVNYSSHNYQLMNNLKAIHHSRRDHHRYKNKFLELLSEIEDVEFEKARAKILHFFHFHFGHRKPAKGYMENPDSGNVMQLMRFKGHKGEKLKTWMLRDQHGNPVVIKECMHQTGITKDYIVLSDTSFKFTLDLLINNFFPNEPLIERGVRKVLSKPMSPDTEIYIVDRRELEENSNQAVAYKLESPIPVETIHYSCDFDNPNNKITLYGMHNAAMCIAEWIRPYDIAKLTRKPVDEDYISLFALGNMDVSRLGKWEIDMNTKSISDSKVLVETGLEDDNKKSNTWSIGLYAYRDMISADEALGKVETMWFVSNGISNKTLTEFIYNMYKNYRNRIVPVEEVLKITEEQVPSCLSRLNTVTMEVTDTYSCPPEVYLRSVQYVPGKNNKEYIFTTVQHGKQKADGKSVYRGEYWIFDGHNLEQGPICRMVHPEVDFCFTLHSCWLPEAKPSNLKYHVGIREDFDKLISRVVENIPENHRIHDFFEEHIYPHFE